MNSDHRSTPRVSVSIMAHPNRATAAEAIRSRLQRFPARVVFDPDPEGARSTIRTARLAWRPWLAEATHHLVIQDDVVLHPDFEKQVEDAVSAQPDSIVSFFSEWGSFTSHALRIAALAGHAFVIQPDTYLGTQAITMRQAAAEKFARYLDDVDLAVPDDHAIWQWAHDSSIRHLVTNPNLVDHDTADSLTGNSFQGVRRSTVYAPNVTADRSWWTRSRPADLIQIPAMHWLGAEPVSYVREHGANAQWTIRPRFDFWESDGADLADLVKVVTAGLCQGVDSESSRLAVEGLAIICADAVAVAASVQHEEIDSVARIFADGAMSSLAPGCLRRIVAENPGSIDLDRASEVFLEFETAVKDLIARSNRRASIQTMFFGPEQSD